MNLDKPLLPQAFAAVLNRDANHHVDDDEGSEPKRPGFRAAVLDKFGVGNAVNYTGRYADAAYLQIRGREQQLIDAHGGAWSDTNPGPHRTENSVRGVAKNNPKGKLFHEEATFRFGELHRFTGN